MFERTQNFENFLADASRRPELWRFLIGIGTAVVVYFAFSAIGFVLIGLLVSREFQIRLMSQLETGSDPIAMFILLASFLGMALGAVFAAFWHKRGFRSLVGPFGQAVRNFGRTLSVTIPVFVLSGVILTLVMDLSVEPQLGFGLWLLYLIPAIPLLLLQTGAEELVFRGYLTQQLAVRFRSVWVWGLLPSILFGFAHFSGEFDPILTVLIVLATGFFGFVAMDLTRITGNLGAATAFHFTNNFFALFLVAIPGQLSGLSLYLAPFTMDNLYPVAPLMIIDIIVIFIAWQILRRKLA